MSDLELARLALRATLETPLAKGDPVRDVAATARLLLELSGAIGRNSKPPVDPGDPLTEMSRADLQALRDGE